MIVVSETSTSITDLYEYQFLSDQNTQYYTANRLQVKSLERAKRVDKRKSEEFREQSDYGGTGLDFVFDVPIHPWW